MTSAPGAEGSLAERLRMLRQSGLSRALTQKEMAAALGGLSLALISWENGKALPTPDRLKDYAAVFGAGGGRGDALPMPDARAPHQLEQELLGLRDRAEAASGNGPLGQAQRPSGGIWHFPDGREICVIASRLPERVISQIDYANFRHPNYIGLLHYADADALIEVFGHLRAVNPGSKVTFKTWDDMVDDDWSKHVVVLGGDWNEAAQWYIRRVDLPVVSLDEGDDESEVDGFFRVTVLDPPRDFRPEFTPSPPETRQLEYDVGLFARSPNPANPDTTLTLCQGIFSRGTFGLVRMFSDVLHRDANEAALAELDSDFGTDRLEWLLVRIPVALGNTVTPNLTRPYLRLAFGTRFDATLLDGAREGARPEV
jgi:transcriptional regulator with XRE-family HTH domain